MIEMTVAHWHYTAHFFDHLRKPTKSHRWRHKLETTVCVCTYRSRHKIAPTSQHPHPRTLINCKITNDCLLPLPRLLPCRNPSLLLLPPTLARTLLEERNHQRKRSASTIERPAIGPLATSSLVTASSRRHWMVVASPTSLFHPSLTPLLLMFLLSARLHQLHWRWM